MLNQNLNEHAYQNKASWKPDMIKTKASVITKVFSYKLREVRVIVIIIMGDKLLLNLGRKFQR